MKLRLQPRRRSVTWNRTVILAAVPVAAVAVIAGVQSFSHIEALALRAHQSIADARLLPFSIDGLIVAGVVIVLAGYWLGWLSVALGVAATVFSNVESGLPHGPLPATVAAWPAIAFSVASFVLERWLNAHVGVGGHGGHSEAAAKAGRSTAHTDVLSPPVCCGHMLTGPPTRWWLTPTCTAVTVSGSRRAG